MRFEYEELNRLIKFKYGTIADFANEIGMPIYCLYNRLKGKAGFKQSEIWQIVEKLGISEAEIARYFFTVKDSKNEEQR